MTEILGLLWSVLGDFLTFIVKSLGDLALFLERRLSIPWPIFIALVALPFMAVLNVATWWFRGNAWRTTCGYKTIKGRPCENPVIGEWNYCKRQHRDARTRETDHHKINPNLNRWQEETPSGGTADRRDVKGLGVFTLRSSKTGFLYTKGFARPWKAVLGELPRDIKRTWDQGKDLITAFRSLGIRGLFTLSEARPQVLAAAHGIQGVRAAQTSLALVSFGLLVTIATTALRYSRGEEDAWYATAQYVAVLGLLSGLVVARQGIWLAGSKQEGTWWIRATRESLKTWIGLVVAAVLGANVFTLDPDDPPLGSLSGVTVLAAVGLFVFMRYLRGDRPSSPRQRRSKSSKSQNRSRPRVRGAASGGTQRRRGGRRKRRGRR